MIPEYQCENDCSVLNMSMSMTISMTIEHEHDSLILEIIMLYIVHNIPFYSCVAVIRYSYGHGFDQCRMSITMSITIEPDYKYVHE